MSNTPGVTPRPTTSRYPRGAEVEVLRPGDGEPQNVGLWAERGHWFTGGEVTFLAPSSADAQGQRVPELAGRVPPFTLLAVYDQAPQHGPGLTPVSRPVTRQAAAPARSSVQRVSIPSLLDQELSEMGPQVAAGRPRRFRVIGWGALLLLLLSNFGVLAFMRLEQIQANRALSTTMERREQSLASELSAIGNAVRGLPLVAQRIEGSLAPLAAAAIERTDERAAEGEAVNLLGEILAELQSTAPARQPSAGPAGSGHTAAATEGAETAAEFPAAAATISPPHDGEGVRGTVQPVATPADVVFVIDASGPLGAAMSVVAEEVRRASRITGGQAQVCVVLLTRDRRVVELSPAAFEALQSAEGSASEHQSLDDCLLVRNNAPDITPCLDRALQHHPKDVFILSAPPGLDSDAVLFQKNLERVLQQRSDPLAARIHVIQFLGPFHELAAVARENGGTFTFIPDLPALTASGQPVARTP